MTTENFLKAIEIITINHSTELIINKVSADSSITKVLESPTISIKNCCASVINNLKLNGFSLSMNNGLMVVDKY